MHLVGLSVDCKQTVNIDEEVVHNKIGASIDATIDDRNRTKCYENSKSLLSRDSWYLGSNDSKSKPSRLQLPVCHSN